VRPMDLRRGEAGGLYYLELAPPDARRDLPLVVGLHGRGAAAEDLGGLAAQLDDEHYRYALFYGPLVLYMGDGIRYAWYDRERAEQTVPAARSRLTVALRELWSRHSVSPARTALFGFSQGGVMTLDVGLHLDERLAGLVCMSGRLYPADDVDASLTRARDRDQAVLIVHGTRDSRMAVQEARETRARLEAAGVRPAYHEFPMDHEVTADSLAAVRDFVQLVLPPA
jgi:phospholipase/carboxylesterase